MRDFIFKIIVILCLVYNLFRSILPNRNIDIIKILDIIFLIITVIGYCLLVPDVLRAGNKNKENDKKD